MTIRPTTIAEVQDTVRSYEALTIRGGGTKGGPRTEVTRTEVDTRALHGIVDYSPDECVFTALAGTPLAHINAELAAHGQYLPFDPPLADAGATIGGTVASGLSGSGRYRYGGVRDFVIGARVVDGEGRLIRSGGRVVKNAAGFLLHHGLVGSLGRWGIIAEVTFKVFPSPEAHATLHVECGSLEGAAYVARSVEQGRYDLAALDFDSAGTMWIRVAGRQQSMLARAQQLLQTIGHGQLLEAERDQEVWEAASRFAWVPGETAIIKIPVTDLSRLRATPFESGTPSGMMARYFCGGRCLWAATNDLPSLSAALSSASLGGQVVRGAAAGTSIGLVNGNAFEERVRSALDPRNRFSASSNSSR